MNFGTSVRPSELPPFPGFFFETPASLGCVYNLVRHGVRGCNPNVTTENPNVSRGSRAIALVEAFDDPTAASDLAVFSTQFGLPAANLQVVYSNGAEPALDPTGGWEIEEALDTQWAHAMAPGAKIYLVEAADNSFTNLFNAVQVASGLVAAAGGGEVSMSWGAGEFLGENTLDGFFTTPGIVYVASTGDSPGVEYPSASPNVVSVGGTSVAAPSLSGVINSAGRFRHSSQQENQLIYGDLFNGFAFRDIFYGTCGVNMGTVALPGYDLCTGVGTVQGLSGK